jgi:hypothetical protein
VSIPFEVLTNMLILFICSSGCIAIGLGEEDFPSSVPGWDDMSWGYHGDDGKIYHDSHSQPYAEKFEVGDIIGCHLKVLSGTVEFVKNGQRLGAQPSFSPQIIPIAAVLIA